MKRTLLLLFTCLATTLFAHAQSNEVTLVVSGEGPNKTEATALALRSAIEQAYGTFVSANTEILNDEIVRDEIATVASGNIKSYKEISSIQTTEGYYVTVQAVVSIGKLIEYSKSHGSSAEFAGQTFAMNIKMKKLNKENELIALKNLREQVRLVANNVFDFQVETDGPVVEGKLYKVSVNIKPIPNSNFDNLWNQIDKTIGSIALSSVETEDWSKSGIKTSRLRFDSKEYVLRNSVFLVMPILNDIKDCFLNAQSSWKLKVKADREVEYQRTDYPNYFYRQGGSGYDDKEYLAHTNYWSLNYKPKVSFLPQEGINLYDSFSGGTNFQKMGFNEYIRGNKYQVFTIDFYFNEMELSTIQGFEVVNDKNYYLARTYNKALRIYSLLSCKMFYDENAFLHDSYGSNRYKVNDFALSLKLEDKMEANTGWQKSTENKTSIMCIDSEVETIRLDNAEFYIMGDADWSFIDDNNIQLSLQCKEAKPNGKECIIRFVEHIPYTYSSVYIHFDGVCYHYDIEDKEVHCN